MIYVQPKPTDLLEQGDIFRNIPQIIYDPENVHQLMETDGITIKKPANLLEIPENNDLQIAARLKLTYGIVISQNCDVQRDDFINFFEISEFFSVTYLDAGKNPTAWWGGKFPKKTHEPQGAKWFYLPQEPTIGFNQKMVADFRSMIPVPTPFLDKNKANLRIGRLNTEALQHFREHVSDYFRRYAYDEWYPLTKEEFEIYKSLPGNENSQPRDYQK